MRIHTETHTCAHTHRRTHTDTCAHMRSHAHTDTRTHRDTCAHACTHVHTHACARTHTHSDRARRLAGAQDGPSSASPEKPPGGERPKEVWFNIEEIRNGFVLGLHQNGPGQGFEPKTVYPFPLPQPEKEEKVSRPDGAGPLYVGNPTQQSSV